MAITVKHPFVSAKPDDADTSLVRPSNWNADHTITGIGTMAEQNANNVAITGGTITGVTGLGDVVGPTSATDNAIARFDTTTGKLIQNSTVTIDDNGNANNLNAVTFDITPATLPTAEGSLYWDSADGSKTLSLVMTGNNAIQQIGEETYYRIKASATITEGQVVMFTGSVGASGALTGAPASGLTASTASYVMGIATENIANNGWGYVTHFGLVRGIDTTAFADGDILYYDPTVAGGLTTTVPSAPNAKIQVCAVTHAAFNGSYFVRPSFGGALGQYEGDVQVTTPANGNLLVRDQTSGKWVNALLSAGTGIAVTNGAGSVSVAIDSTVATLTGTQTLTNKTITARVSSTTSISSPLADNSDNFDMYAATAQAGALTISADAGTPTDGRKIQFRLTCDATPRVITFTGGVSKGFKPVGVTMTASGSDFTYTLTASKTTYFGAIYNTSSARWEIVAISQEA